MKDVNPVVWIIIAVMVLGVASTIGEAFDSYFDNRDSMLCNSAKVSDNEEYLKKCECFYEGESIRCVYEFERKSDE